MNELAGPWPKVQVNHIKCSNCSRISSNIRDVNRGVIVPFPVLVPVVGVRGGARTICADCDTECVYLWQIEQVYESMAAYLDAQERTADYMA